MHLAVLPLAGGEGLLAHSIRGEPATFDRLVLVCTAVEWWERHQVVLYLAAIAVGAVVGLLVPAVADPLESAINPVLGLLLYATFLGVPFTAIVTISDPDAEQPVFNDMRQNLQALGTQIADIRTAARITPRV